VPPRNPSARRRRKRRTCRGARRAHACGFVVTVRRAIAKANLPPVASSFDVVREDDRARDARARQETLDQWGDAGAHDPNRDAGALATLEKRDEGGIDLRLFRKDRRRLVEATPDEARLRFERLAQRRLAFGQQPFVPQPRGRVTVCAHQHVEAVAIGYRTVEIDEDDHSRFLRRVRVVVMAAPVAVVARERRRRLAGASPGSSSAGEVAGSAASVRCFVAAVAVRRVRFFGASCAALSACSAGDCSARAFDERDRRLPSAGTGRAGSGAASSSPIGLRAARRRVGLATRGSSAGAVRLGGGGSTAGGAATGRGAMARTGSGGAVCPVTSAVPSAPTRRIWRSGIGACSGSMPSAVERPRPRRRRRRRRRRWPSSAA